jgi:hypothetical protein
MHKRRHVLSAASATGGVAGEVCDTKQENKGMTHKKKKKTKKNRNKGSLECLRFVQARGEALHVCLHTLPH